MTKENADHLITWNDSDTAGRAKAFEQHSLFVILKNLIF